MRPLVHVALGLAILGASPRADDPPGEDNRVKQELQRLQGGWTFESLRQNGDVTKAEALAKRVLFFGGDAFVVLDAGAIVQAGKIQVDPAKTPRTLNLIVDQGDHRGETLLGIFEFEDDLLRACIGLDGQSRPAGFKVEDGTPKLLLTARHVGRPADEAISIVGAYVSRTEGPGGDKLDYDVTIERRGDAYLVIYKKDGRPLYVGTGLRTGDVLSMAWATQGQTGVSTYKIEKGPRLTGRYAELGGIGITAKETMTPAKVKE